MSYFSKFIFLFHNAAYRNGENKAYSPVIVVMGLACVQIFLIYSGFICLADLPPLETRSPAERKFTSLITVVILVAFNYLFFVTGGYFQKYHERYKDTRLNDQVKSRWTAVISLMGTMILSLLLAYLLLPHKE